MMLLSLTVPSSQKKEPINIRYNLTVDNTVGWGITGTEQEKLRFWKEDRLRGGCDPEFLLKAYHTL